MPEKNNQQEYLSVFGQELKNLRINLAKKSLRLFSYEADIPCATLSRLENGTRIPNIITLKKIASELNISVSSLLDKIEQDMPEHLKNFEP